MHIKNRRIISALLGVAIFCLTTMSVFGQQQAMSGFTNAPLRTVLDAVEDMYDVVFSYRDQNIAQSFITVPSGSFEIDDLLSLIFDQTDLIPVRIDDRHIIVRKKEENDEGKHLCGIISDAETGDLLPFASVQLAGTITGVSADENGRFACTIHGNVDSLIISYVGYRPLAMGIESLQEKPCRNIALSIETQTLAPITLVEYLTDGIDQDENGNKIIIRPKNLSTLPGSVEPDIMTSLQMLPGIFSANETASGLNIRGGTPDQNLILYDRIPIYHSGHFFGMISAFNPYIIEGVDVYRSSIGSEYGGRVSGVIDIHSDQAIPDKVHGSAGFNLTHGHLNLSVPIGDNLAIYGSARRSFTDFWSTPTFEKYAEKVFQGSKIEENDNNVNLETSDEFYFTDANIKILWNPGKNRFGFNVFGSDNNLNYTSSIVNFPGYSQDLLNQTNEGSSIFWERDWTDKFTSNLTITNTEYEYDYSLSYRRLLRPDQVLARFASTNSVLDEGFNWINTWKLYEHQRLKFGYQFTKNDIALELISENSTRTDMQSQEFVHRLHTLFTEYQFDLPGVVKVDVGVRYQRQSVLKKDYFEPRASISAFINEHLQLKLSSSKQFQFVSQLIILDLNDIDVSNAIWIAANGREIPVIESNQWMAGVVYRQNGWTLDVEGYVKELAGITTLSSSFANLPEQPYSRGDSRIRGIDVLVKKRFGKYRSWLSYTLSSALYEFPQISEEAFPASHDQRHALQWVHIYKSGPWEASLGWQIRTGLPYTQTNGIDINTGPLGKKNPFLVYEDQNSSKLDPYHRLDASLMYHFGDKAGLHGFVGLSLNNMYDRTNIIGREYLIDNYDPADDSYDLIEISEGGLRFTPNFVIRIAW